MLVKWRWRILMLSLTVLIAGKQIYLFLSSWDCQHFLLSRFVDYCDPLSVCMYKSIWLCVYACVYVYVVHIHVCTTEERGQKSWSVVFLHCPLPYFFSFTEPVSLDWEGRQAQGDFLLLSLHFWYCTDDKHHHIGLLHGCWDLNSGPHACMASTLATEPTLSPI